MLQNYGNGIRPSIHRLRIEAPISTKKVSSKNEDAFPFLNKSFSLQLCSPNHSLHIIQCSVEDALLIVERTYLLHLVVAEGKIKYLDIFLYIIGIGSTRYDREAFLNVLAQDDLDWRFAMVISYHS